MSEAIAEYQAANPASVASFSGIVPWLNERGYNVSYATHGVGGSERSNDAIVDSSGTTWDLLIGSSETNPRWMVGNAGAYDPTRRVVGASGQSQTFSEWQASVGGTSPTPGGTSTSTGPTSTTTGGPGTGGLPNWDPMDPSVPPPNRQPSVPAPGRRTEPGIPTPPGTTASAAMYAAAYAAQSRYRQRGSGQGRSTTIGAGFGGGAPRTAPATILGSR